MHLHSAHRKRTNLHNSRVWKLLLRRELCLRRTRYVSFLPPVASAHMQVSVQIEQLPCLPSTTKLECSAWLKCNMEDISPSGVLIYMIGAQKGVPCHIHPFSCSHVLQQDKTYTHAYGEREWVQRSWISSRRKAGEILKSLAKHQLQTLRQAWSMIPLCIPCLEISYTTKLNLSPVRMSYGFWPLL